jgi:phosphoribosylaminoimidazole-succinocarboxamide synthase
MLEELHKYREQLEGRSILVKKAEVIPLEAIVRGYITGEQNLNNGIDLLGHTQPVFVSSFL